MTAPSRSGTTRLLRTRSELREALATIPRPLGLVPTMGWLHDGHRSLMQQARAENATTIATIFVNPRQFNIAADYQRYPRNEARDLAICEQESIDFVFAPAVDEVFPPGFDTVVSVGAIAGPLEGAARPGHFDGVATVVAILFNLVGAERAYFGQKDAQQVMVIRQMARDLAIPTRVIACPTVREPDGLALSSRNVHLSPDERGAAPVLHRALLAARRRWEAGERSAAALRESMEETLAHEPLANPEYVSVADGRTLAELERVEGTALLSLAVRFGSTRLIDNELLEPPD
ncbi:MAG TPA: pantoate--beta-alanine ligase [Candidatus Limnocylindrales bacterium]|nr:pantoate--beta-alanine ligase [Candidatus Limnocylindrales bacterium]